jgi:NTP pyrophosphatase (non-canonical NTP hydrolase)
MSFLRDLQVANVIRCPDFKAGNLHDWSLAERGNELAGETGELCNVLKKLLRLHKALQHRLATREDAAREIELTAMAREELGDVVICASLIAAQLDVDLEAAVRDKFNATSRKIGSNVEME